MIHRLVLLGMLAAFLLAACAPGPRPTHQVIVPTLGPARGSVGGKGTPHWELTASTNCAEIGDIVTFTAAITNETDVTLTISGTPALDIIISPAAWRSKTPMPVEHWSASPQYPAQINPVLAPGEGRVYSWAWTVSSVYGQDGVKGAQAQFVTGEIQARGYSIPAGGVQVGFGVGLTWITPYDFVHCSEMQP